MTKSTKPPPIYGNDLPITPFQIKRIMQNCSYQIETKNEYVQWVTGDVKRTSLKSITQAEAVKILKQQTGQTQDPSIDEFKVFDNGNQKHKVILSLLYQANWTVMDGLREIPDMSRFAKWLTEKAPVKKPLPAQDNDELEKTIKALKGVVKSTYK
jgi:hypothetical protein